MGKERIDLTSLYKKQISFTEWFENIKHEKTESLRKEDNGKRDRLGILDEIIGLPYDKPVQFEAADLESGSEGFMNFLNEHGEELCALRLIPKEEGLPKLRMRGHKVKDVMKWFKEQNVDSGKYKADFVPHLENYLWSSIFVVNSRGIFGEVIRGGHHQLTQGFHDAGKPIAFTYDFADLRLSSENNDARKHISEIISRIKVEDVAKRMEILHKLNGKFNNDYLLGYFETVKSAEKGLWFVDYNQTLAELYDGFFPVFGLDSEALLEGRGASLGKARGKARVIEAGDIGKSDILSDEILVCNMTSPDYFTLMQKCAGIITDGGGILSHAAIVARELGKPCIVGTEKATQVLKNGDFIEVDADNGIVRRLS